MRPYRTGAALLLACTVAACGGPSGSSEDASGLSDPVPPPDYFKASGTPSASGLDVDGDGLVGSQTDAMLITRYTLGFRGNALIKGATGPRCSRCTPEQIAAYLDSL